ncbi:hypothetical protein EVAR_10499_1 [Eumeta japonica]|uniref:Uncharacterized protein n=1 Tax=Eumeta variegata TaxID=151549 RepID=A0A4C1TIK7_EUMVA|nr:hypothetical protein EVAR_10499_1 [Eumeta japonica]
MLLLRAYSMKGTGMNASGNRIIYHRSPNRTTTPEPGVHPNSLHHGTILCVKFRRAHLNYVNGYSIGAVSDQIRYWGSSRMECVFKKKRYDNASTSRLYAPCYIQKIIMINSNNKTAVTRLLLELDNQFEQSSDRGVKSTARRRRRSQATAPAGIAMLARASADAVRALYLERCADSECGTSSARPSPSARGRSPQGRGVSALTVNNGPVADKHKHSSTDRPIKATP